MTDNRPFVFSTLISAESAKERLRTNGVALIPGACSKELCDSLRDWIEHVPDLPSIERRYGGTETRIWKSEQYHESIAAFREESDRLVTAALGEPAKAETILAIRNQPIGDNRSLALGRWHIDSFRRQIKVFVFLTDTSIDSGPFEFVPGTHRMSFKLRGVLGGHYFHPGDVRRTGRAYQQLSESWIDRLTRSDRQVSSVLCERGTAMLIDTSAIHRARPCERIERAALTAYYR